MWFVILLYAIALVLGFYYAVTPGLLLALFTGMLITAFLVVRPRRY